MTHHSCGFDEHLEHLTEVFERIRAAGLFLKASKCTLARSDVDYLGHLQEGVAYEWSRA